jgi:hypothetical protein
MTPMDEPKTFTISESVTDAVIAYLERRPFNEVAHLIAAIQAEHAKSQAKTEPKVGQ